MQQVDVITLGAGGGAYPAAFRLARAGRQVLMVDPKGVMSGNCLAEGCVPSKAVREYAELSRQASRFGLGRSTEIDLAHIMTHKDRVQRTRYTQHAAELEKLSAKLSLIQGRARFQDANTVVVENDSGTKSYRAEHIIIATGADIFVPPIPGAEHCMTSRDLFALNPTMQSLPRRLIIIGGGYIGLETASILHALGSEVTLLEQQQQLLPGIDPDFVAGLTPLLDPTIRMITGAEVASIEPTTAAVLKVSFRTTEGDEVLAADAVLMAAGRHPVIPEGLEALGVQVERGRIMVDSTLRTSVPHIYACGDVNGRVPLFHAAVGQSLTAARNILGGDRAPMDYFDFNSVPTTIFTLPAAAYVGRTRAALQAMGREAIEAAYVFAEDSRAQIYDEPDGELRLFFEPGSLRLMGGWVLGIDAGQLIGQIGLAVSKGLTARDLAAFCDQHPMASEGISKAARRLF
ncbi:dihydrolipoyl dehydrogenase [Acidihalobacter aeolianus]|uniref:Dihydrolipoyl dehydrogenase n=1 Tax=Acidihalobacter aeolianus TaxID=2792603 RepID=A0A1D8K7C9_9GAMM|nr:dihydrolipoyl dehydrogenase [Acidihalobacter aeolianus]AOV16846.1 dihydrolipoyl dehydrogenase [Acidihalobacter aeolianus]